MNIALATLQEMILAARAEGESDLADWLASIADDPETVAEVTGKAEANESVGCLESDSAPDAVGRWLLEHGFTGTDRRGVKWVDGKEVKSTDAGGGPHTAPATDAAVESKAKSLASRIASVPKQLVQKVSSWVAARHEKLAARYGKTGARAILGAMILLAPTPVPGSSLIPIALGEAVLRLRRAVGGARTEALEGEELSAEEVERIARELLAELEGLREDDVQESLLESEHKEGEEWVTNGRKYRRTAGKTVRVGKAQEPKPDPKPKAATPQPASPKPAEAKPPAESQPKPAPPAGPIDWQHKDASHPIAKAVASDPIVNKLARRAQEHAATQAELKTAEAHHEQLWQEFMNAPRSTPEQSKAKVAIGDRWKAALDHARGLREKVAAANDSFRAEVFESLKVKTGVPINAEFSERRSSWNPVGINIMSKAEALKGSDEFRAKSVEYNEAAMNYAVRLVSSIFESRGVPVDVEVGFSRSGRGFLQPVGPSIGPLKLLNRKPIIGMGIKARPEDAQDTAIHELGHLLEETNPDVKKQANEFLKYRCGDDPMVDLASVPGGEAMKGEKGRPDDFGRSFDPVSACYVGKTYNDNSTEIVSMGLEKLHRDPIGFLTRDPEYAGFIIGILRRAKA